MQITEIEFHGAGRLWHGEAVSTRGRRYQFGYKRVACCGAISRFRTKGRERFGGAAGLGVPEP